LLTNFYVPRHFLSEKLKFFKFSLNISEGRILQENDGEKV
jgi:hypothetical protein